MAVFVNMRDALQHEITANKISCLLHANTNKILMCSTKITFSEHT